MQKIKILIADDNIEFACLVRDYLSKLYDFQIAGVCYDGKQVIDYLENNENESPDVVLLDIIMPKYDGIAVLEYLHNKKLLKRSFEDICFIMLTAVGQELFIKKALDLGASYFILKPIELEVIAKRIKDLVAISFQRYESSQNTNYLADNFKDFMLINRNHLELSDEIAIEIATAEMLRKNNILPHLAGYQYLIYAIKKIILEGNKCTPITKKLYPDIAQKFGSTPTKVERCIRNAIECGWKGREGKPSNFEFIMEIAELIKKMNKKSD